MQDRYAGDVGDFLKLNLLKTLAGGDLTLGVNWYLTTGGPKGDGRHITYLKPSNRIGQSLRKIDEELYASLQPFAEEGAERSVCKLEARSTLLESTVFYGEYIDDREHWHDASLMKLADADLVFLDPDNGLKVSGGGSGLHKYARPSELSDYVKGGKSVVLYQHADRSCSVDQQVERRLDDVAAAADREPLAAVVARRGTVRFFLILAQLSHQERLTARLRSYQQRTWGTTTLSQHARVVWRDTHLQVHPTDD